MIRNRLMLLSALLVCGVAHAQVRGPVPRAETIGEGVVWRTSGNRDRRGRDLPPWQEVRVTNIFTFTRKPAVGERVTVIPLARGLTPLDLRIVKTEKRENACDERLSDWWEVDLEPITRRDFFDAKPNSNRAAEFPFDVAIIYPAVKAARLVSRGRLSKAALPAGVAVKTVKAALDLTHDGKPDVIVVEHCCEDARRPAEGCDYTCGKTFRKTGNRWKLIDTSAPC